MSIRLAPGHVSKGQARGRASTRRIQPATRTWSARSSRCSWRIRWKRSSSAGSKSSAYLRNGKAAQSAVLEEREGGAVGGAEPAEEELPAGEELLEEVEAAAQLGRVAGDRLLVGRSRPELRVDRI